MEVIFTQDNDFFDKCENYLLESNIKSKQITDFSSLISYIKNDSSDRIMIDYDYHHIDLEVLKDLINSNLSDKNKLVIISNNPEVKTLGVTTINRGYFIKDYKKIKNKNHTSDTTSQFLVKDFIYERLIDYGLKPTYSGFHYLLELILLINEKRELINSLYHECYNILAVKFDTSISNIERNIRTAKKYMKEQIKNKALILNLLQEIDNLNN